MNENEIIEEWRPICGFEGLYEVSNLGRVKSLKDRYGNLREKILKQIQNDKGYLKVNLANGKRKTSTVHRLVALSFIPNPNNLPTVNHINEDKTDNCVYNLEWMNMSQQVRHGTCQQRRVANTDYKARSANTDYKVIGRKNAEKLSKQVYQYTLDYKLIKIWSSTRECGRNGFGQSAVAACCRGKLKHYKNYIWSYVEIKK